MIPLYKLERLPAGQRRRKLALILAGLERALGGAATQPADPDYLCGIVRLSLEDPKLDLASRDELSRLVGEVAASDKREDGAFPELLRLCNRARHAILAAAGSFPAEWDLIVPGSASAEFTATGSVSRPYFPGIYAYAEDIRSPFNLGSIFRTAEAFGAERLFISPLCVPPEHPRALRSAMGCVEYIPWERRALEDLSEDMPIFALETGGTPIEEFDFPERGMVIIGSEELGISPEGLERATYGRVSIPMKGIKASLNVGVAFGILMQSWTAYRRCSDSNPD